LPDPINIPMRSYVYECTIVCQARWENVVPHYTVGENSGKTLPVSYIGWFTEWHSRHLHMLPLIRYLLREKCNIDVKGCLQMVMSLFVYTWWRHCLHTHGDVTVCFHMVTSLFVYIQFTWPLGHLDTWTLGSLGNWAPQHLSTWALGLLGPLGSWGPWVLGGFWHSGPLGTSSLEHLDPWALGPLDTRGPWALGALGLLGLLGHLDSCAIRLKRHLA
jgi:hypothetical protein